MRREIRERRDAIAKELMSGGKGLVWREAVALANQKITCGVKNSDGTVCERQGIPPTWRCAKHGGLTAKGSSSPSGGGKRWRKATSAGAALVGVGIVVAMVGFLASGLVTTAPGHHTLKEAATEKPRAQASETIPPSETKRPQEGPISDLHQKAEQLEEKIKEAEEKRDTARDRAETRVEASSSRIGGEKQGNEAKPETKSESQQERLEATAQKQQKLVIKDCETCPELIVVPAGSFLMGSPPYEEGRSHGEGPQRWVTIGHSFAVGRFAITVDEFKEFVNDTGFHTGDLCAASEEYVARSAGSFESPRSFAAGFVQGGRHPVVCVSWLHAKAFVAWLSNKTKRNYRLLTEAEREYVTRAGTSTAYWWGDGITPSQALYDVTSNSTRNSEIGAAINVASAGGTTPVDQYQPNPWGLFQVHGNVAEWVEDCWTTTIAMASISPAAVVLPNCKGHVLRGGAWSYPKTALRAAFREHAPASGSYNHVGFRVARDLDEQDQRP